MYVQAYLDNGIRIDTLVPQNEPGYGPNGYPSMIVEAWQEAELGRHSITCLFERFLLSGFFEVLLKRPPSGNFSSDELTRSV